MFFQETNPEIGKEILAALKPVKDWPKPGINFADITPVLLNASLFSDITYELGVRIEAVNGTMPRNDNVVVAGLDARGFIFGAACANELNLGFLMVRKASKVPRSNESEIYVVEYDLEYGKDSVGIRRDVDLTGKVVILVDDLIATGGTLAASCELMKLAGAADIICACVIDIPALGGSARLEELTGNPVISLATL